MSIERYKRYTKNDNAPGGFMERGEAKKKVAKKMSSKWHPLAAGRVGDKYKGGTITEIDARNARAKIK